jgi:hypothetical protein
MCVCNKATVYFSHYLSNKLANKIITGIYLQLLLSMYITPSELNARDAVYINK